MNENKMSNEIKRGQLAILAYLYQLGFDHHTKEYWEEIRRKIKELPEAEAIEQRTRALKESKEIRKEFKEFQELQKEIGEKLDENAKLIIEEAKKRKCDVPELIDYFFKHKEELLELLNKKDYKLGKEVLEVEDEIPGQLTIFEKEYLPEIKVDLSRIPRDIIDFANNFYISRLSKKDYIGIEESEEYGKMEKWVANDIGYLVKRINYLNELFGKPPKVHISQDKNIKLLIALIEQKQFNQIKKKAQVSFTLKEYAKYRGFTEEEFANDGRIYQELRRDLFSGALTFYSVPIERNDKEYTIYGSLYQLEVPKDRGGKWTVIFNGRYAESIERILHGSEKGYFTHYLKEIADRTTNREIHLHEFYNQLVFRRRKSGTTMPTKIIKILKAMKLPDKILIRPKECFKVLKNCLVYFSDKYPEELNQITVYNNYNKNETVKLPLGLTEAFTRHEYEDFKDLVFKRTRIKDFREALISFKGNPIKKRKSKKHKIDLDEIDLEESDIINRIIDWAYGNWDIKKDKSEVYEYLHKFINKKGYNHLEQLFDREANIRNPNAIDFLFKVLPLELKRINEPVHNSDILP